MNNKLEQRLLVYGPLGLLCGLAGIWLGAAAAIWSFVQVVAVVELTNWLAAPAHDSSDAAMSG
jgi:hypothetical protein